MADIIRFPCLLNPKTLIYGWTLLEAFMSFWVMPKRLWTKILWILVCVYLFVLIFETKLSNVFEMFAASFILYSNPSDTSGSEAISCIDIFLRLYIICFSKTLKLGMIWPSSCCSSISS